MMNTYTIHFIGLVCHIGKDPTNKTVAAMVDDDDHVAAVTLYGAPHEVEDADSIRFRLNGELQDAYYATTDAAFNSAVPSIQAVMDGTILPDLKSEAVLVHYPPGHRNDGGRTPGTLSVKELYHCFGRHRIGGVIKRPVSRVGKEIVLTIQTPYPELAVVKMVGDEEFPLGTIGPGGQMLISNIFKSDWNFLKSFIVENQLKLESVERAHAHAHENCEEHVDSGHFGRFGRLLSGENNSVTVDQLQNNGPKVQTTISGWVDVVMLALEKVGAMVATHVECGNTDYP